jgi:hypothetical protein
MLIPIFKMPSPPRHIAIRMSGMPKSGRKAINVFQLVFISVGNTRSAMKINRSRQIPVHARRRFERLAD